MKILMIILILIFITLFCFKKIKIKNEKIKVKYLKSTIKIWSIGYLVLLYLSVK